MSRKASGLGRGLDALLPKGSLGVVRLPIAAIRSNPNQPRRRFSEEGLAELAASIREKGLLQPLLVRPKGEGYELVAGERRYRAALMAGLEEVPAVVKDLSDREALEVALVENLQREDLSPVEEARGYQALLEMGLTQEEVAKRVGKARSTVANALRLLQLPEEALSALEEGQITPGHARALLMLPPEDRLWGLKEVLKKGLSVREAEALKAKPRKPSSSLEDEVLSLELSRHLGFPVRVLGKEKGRVVIRYRSREELWALLERLGYQA